MVGHYYEGYSHKYTSKNLTVSMMVKYSFSTAAKLVSLEDSFQEKNATGGPSHPCHTGSTPAMPTLEASVWITNSLVKSGSCNTGPEVSALFNVSKGS